MASIFTKIIDGDIPAFKLAEDEHFLSFLDVKPVKRGHALVIPKKEIDYIFDMAAEDLAAFHVFSQKVARGIEKAIPCKRIGVAVVGLEVPHAHIHLIPLDAIEDIRFTGERLSFDQNEFEKIAAEIRNHIF